MNSFNKLKQISDNYKSAVDELAEDYELSGRQDYRYNDAIKAQRLQARNADFNRQLDKLAQKALEAAAPEIGKLNEAINDYIINSTDVPTVQTVAALLSSGVTLFDEEIAAFAQKGGYGVLRLLEKPSKGHIMPPSLPAFEHDLESLRRHFETLSDYRGYLVEISPQQDRRWAVIQNTTTAGALDGFSEKLDAMATRWSVLENWKEADK